MEEDRYDEHGCSEGDKDYEGRINTIFESLWCSSCGFVGDAKVTGEGSYAVDEEGHYHVDSYEFDCTTCGEYGTCEVIRDGYHFEVAHWEGNLFDQDDEKAETFLSKLNCLKEKADYEAQSNPVIAQLMTKLCLEDLDDEVISIVMSSEFDDILKTIIIANDPFHIAEAAQPILDMYPSTYIELAIPNLYWGLSEEQGKYDKYSDWAFFEKKLHSIFTRLWCGCCGAFGKVFDYDFEFGHLFYSEESDGWGVKSVIFICEICDANVKLRAKLKNYKFQLVSWEGDLYELHDEKASKYFSELESLKGRVDREVQSDPVIQQLMTKLCLQGLGHEVVAIFSDNGVLNGFTNNTFIIADNPANVLEDLQRALDKSTNPKVYSDLFHLTSLEELSRSKKEAKADNFGSSRQIPYGETSEIIHTGDVETKNKKKHTSVIKLKNKDMKGIDQVVITKLPWLNTDIYAKKTALKDPTLFDSLVTGLEVEFSMHESNGYFHVDDGSLEIINAASKNSVTNTQNSEEAFIRTLNKLNSPFLYFDKSFANYSNCFKAQLTNKQLGRPDFILCKPGLGTYVVDVSVRNIQSPVKYVGEPCITISKDDFKMASRFHRTFCLPWWWAIRDVTASNEDHNWFMLSLFDFESFYREQSQIQEESDEISKFIKPGFINIPLKKARLLNLDIGDSALFT
jgi:hypothetical protein